MSQKRPSEIQTHNIIWKKVRRTDEIKYDFSSVALKKKQTSQHTPSNVGPSSDARIKRPTTNPVACPPSLPPNDSPTLLPDSNQPVHSPNSIDLLNLPSADLGTDLLNLSPNPSLDARVSSWNCACMWMLYTYISLYTNWRRSECSVS